ncbi:helix-turn-helix domain protein [Hydrogenophaga sp. RAC07]|uniref:helix-turn-helix domain-containing protein n=1 Tax=Hydrogenophaga sp. RAC07 TaxID=1842537 RepID=UPI00083CCF09|nr:helix-turn-helix domain-containing protein [Hydrogenophaga sp. RAC07]AOF86501.1 helix-turn-helix domain protein [Hydrogenophaga sp. RAC07]
MNEAPHTDQDANGASKETHINFTAHSTSVEAQRDRILTALREGPKTSYDLRRIGCYQAPARIKELKDRFGYVIRTERVTLYDRDAFCHPGAARYHLDGEPEAGFVPKPQTDAAGMLREAAKAIRAQAKGLERDSIKLEHIPNVRQRLIEALRVLSALERGSFCDQYARAREARGV